MSALQGFINNITVRTKGLIQLLGLINTTLTPARASNLDNLADITAGTVALQEDLGKATDPQAMDSTVWAALNLMEKQLCGIDTQIRQLNAAVRTVFTPDNPSISAPGFHACPNVSGGLQNSSLGPILSYTDYSFPAHSSFIVPTGTCAVSATSWALTAPISHFIPSGTPNPPVGAPTTWVPFSGCSNTLATSLLITVNGSTPSNIGLLWSLGMPEDGRYIGLRWSGTTYSFESKDGTNISNVVLGATINYPITVLWSDLTSTATLTDASSIPISKSINRFLPPSNYFMPFHLINGSNLHVVSVEYI